MREYYQAFVSVYGAESYWYWKELAPKRAARGAANQDVEDYRVECRRRDRCPAETRVDHLQEDA